MKIVEDITELIGDMMEDMPNKNKIGLRKNYSIYLVLRDHQSAPAIELCNHECLEDRLAKYYSREGIIKSIQVYQVTYSNPPTLKLLKKNELWKKYKNSCHKLGH